MYKIVSTVNPDRVQLEISPAEDGGVASGGSMGSLVSTSSGYGSLQREEFDSAITGGLGTEARLQM